jgi:hypothetical protein
MTDAAQIADRYIAVWNETDQARRRALLAEGWAENATYVDPVMSGEGREQIGALIAAVHERFPGFRFKLEGRADAAITTRCVFLGRWARTQKLT